jgi:hypothetical protein
MITPSGRSDQGHPAVLPELGHALSKNSRNVAALSPAS